MGMTAAAIPIFMGMTDLVKTIDKTGKACDTVRVT
jgi:hypothetical protein